MHFGDDITATQYREHGDGTVTAFAICMSKNQTTVEDIEFTDLDSEQTKEARDILRPYTDMCKFNLAR